MSPDQSLNVDVFVDNKRLAQCSDQLVYSYSNTPVLSSIIPSAAAATDKVYFRGIQRVSGVSEIDEIRIGDYHCIFKDIYEENEYTFYAHSTVNIQCKVPNVEPGFYNVSQKNTGSTGNAKKLNTVITYSNNAPTYDFVVVP